MIQSAVLLSDMVEVRVQLWGIQYTAASMSITTPNQPPAVSCQVAGSAIPCWPLIVPVYFSSFLASED